MQPLPHHYRVSAHAESDAGDVTVRSPGLPDLASNAPAEYDGPGDRWSPETLFVAAIADCYVLTFRAIARASKLDWQDLRCEVEGILSKAEKGARFTHVSIRAELAAPGATRSRAERILHKAEETCLVTNSLNARVELDASVTAAD